MEHFVNFHRSGFLVRFQLPDKFNWNKLWRSPPTNPPKLKTINSSPIPLQTFWNENKTNMRNEKCDSDEVWRTYAGRRNKTLTEYWWIPMIHWRLCSDFLQWIFFFKDFLFFERYFYPKISLHRSPSKSIHPPSFVKRTPPLCLAS